MTDCSPTQHSQPTTEAQAQGGPDSPSGPSKGSRIDSLLENFSDFLTWKPSAGLSAVSLVWPAEPVAATPWQPADPRLPCLMLDITRLRHDPALTSKDWRPSQTPAAGKHELSGAELPDHQLLLTIDPRDLTEPFSWLREMRVTVATIAIFHNSERLGFACQATKNGDRCGQQVLKLYLPAGERQFACMDCHDFRYFRHASKHLTKDGQLLELERVKPTKIAKFRQQPDLRVEGHRSEYGNLRRVEGLA